MREPTLVPLSCGASQISAGDAHAAVVTSDKRLFTWGCNEQGQLGHKESPVGEVKLKSVLVSCGVDYTICLTEECELLITGRLPFEVASQHRLAKFEQLAKFERSVQVKQIESSKFTSILAQLPGDDRTELFLWGDTPLGVF